MGEGEYAEVIPFKPKPSDAAKDLRTRLQTPEEGNPLGDLDPRLELELLDKIPRLQAAVAHAEETFNEETKDIAEMWGINFQDIERDPRAENFLPMVQEFKRIQKELGAKMIEAQAQLRELQDRIENIRSRRRAAKAV